MLHSRRGWRADMPMKHLTKVFCFGRAPALAALTAVALAAAGCGGSGSGDATKLLNQTFSGRHHVTSGDVSLAVTIALPGSSTLKSPVRLSLGGPFQSRGAGKLPQSDFTVSFGANGKTGALSVLSTGTAGYVTLEGTSYRLPAATFERLESSFAQVASSAGGQPASGTLGGLGIRPLTWLRNPTIVGDEKVGGASTTHIRAAVNVPGLVENLSTLLAKASSLGVSGANQFSGGLSAAQRRQVAAAVRNPRFDVWTGSSDKTLRKLAIGLSLPVSGPLATLGGGASSADVGLTIQYSDLNQPQTITAPATVRPFGEFQGKIQTFVQTLEGGLLGSSGAAGGLSGSSGAPGGSAASVQSYSQCIQAAGNNAGKQQQCASLLGTK